MPDQSLIITPEVLHRLTALRSESKFSEENLYPGAPTEEIRLKAERAVNAMLDRLAVGLRQSPRKSYVLAFSLALVMAMLCSGCILGHATYAVLYSADKVWYKTFPKGPIVTGTNGSSFETALRVHQVSLSDLPGAEEGWVYQAYWMHLTPARPLDEFGRSIARRTERQGKKVYDIVVLTLPDGETRTTYFDVTNYRYFWPKDA